MGENMINDAVPVASPDEPTTAIVWETYDQNTVRVRFEDHVNPDISDGVPTEVEGERSATVAVLLPDMLEPLELMAQMGRRDRLNIHTVALQGTAGTGKVGVINVTIGHWREFKKWFPEHIGELQYHVLRSYRDPRMGSAIMFRLRLLANQIHEQNRNPPNGLNIMVLRVEQ